MIAQILAGDSRLFHELIRPYERAVDVKALSFLHNEADAEDGMQEAFLKVFRNLAGFREEAEFGTWLISITLNEARSLIRRKNAVKMESGRGGSYSRLCCATRKKFPPMLCCERT